MRTNGRMPPASSAGTDHGRNMPSRGIGKGTYVDGPSLDRLPHRGNHVPVAYERFFVGRSDAGPIGGSNPSDPQRRLQVIVRGRETQRRSRQEGRSLKTINAAMWLAPRRTAAGGTEESPPRVYLGSREGPPRVCVGRAEEGDSRCGLSSAAVNSAPRILIIRSS